MRGSTILNHSAVYFVGNVLRRAVGFLMIPVYTRFLTPSDYGVIELVELFVSVACLTFGISAITDSMVRIYHDYQEPKQKRETTSTAILGVAAISLLVAAIAIPFAGWISATLFRTPSYKSLIQMAFVAMIFSNVCETALVYQRIRKRAVFYVLFSVLQLALNLGLNIYFIAILHKGAWGFVMSKLVYASLSAVVAVVLVWRETGFSFRWIQARQIASFGWPLVLTSVSFFTIHFADRFFLSKFSGLNDVGVYALSYKFAFLVTFLVGEPFGSVWNVSLYEQTSSPSWRQEFARVAGYLMFFLFFVALCISVFATEILTLTASPAFAAAAITIPALVFAYVFREIGDFFRAMMFINKRVLAFSKITVSCAVLNLGLDWVLISRYHAVGASYSTLLTWTVYLGICWYSAQREHRLPSLVRPFAALCGISAVSYGFAYLNGSIQGPWLWAWHSLAIAVFLLLVWGSGYFSATDKDSIREYVLSGRNYLSFRAARWR